MSSLDAPRPLDLDTMALRASFRRRSLLLSSLPWTTDCVMRTTLSDGFSSDATNDTPTVGVTLSIISLNINAYLTQKFLRAVDAMEADVLASSHPSEWAQIRQLMQLDEADKSELEIWSLDRNKGKMLQSRLLGVLVSFRLVDIMSWVARGPSGGVPRILKAPAIGSHAKKVSFTNVVCLVLIFAYSCTGMGKDEGLGVSRNEF